MLGPIPMPEVVVSAGADERSAWLVAGARMLADAVRAAGPQQPVWTWRADQSAGFWLRRMLHDEVVHRFDAELALGIEGDLAADPAADGVSDLLDTAATLPAAPSRLRVAAMDARSASRRCVIPRTQPSSSGYWRSQPSVTTGRWSPT
jgi:hypothetical protein